MGAVLAFLGNVGPQEIVLLLVVAVLIFGKDLPQAASKAYLQVRKLRNAVDDLRRETGIDRELRNIERTVREAEWEARNPEPARPSTPTLPRRALASPGEGSAPAEPTQAPVEIETPAEPEAGTPGAGSPDEPSSSPDQPPA